MSLTQAENAFGSVYEAGLNDLLRAFFTARPRYLNYGTPFFVPTTTALATTFPPILFPGVPGGLQLAVSFSIPTVDITPAGAGSAPLPPGPGQFTIKTDVTLRALCGVIDPDRQSAPGGIREAQLTIFALCHPVRVGNNIGIGVDRIEIVDISPGELESLIECLLELIVRAVLANFLLPFTTVTAGAFGLTLVAGPLAEADQVKIRGNII
jgi:hypothetical protein